jgi:hypothetical protein
MASRYGKSGSATDGQMPCPIMWSAGPFRDRTGERAVRAACPACGVLGVASVDNVTRWHP